MSQVARTYYNENALDLRMVSEYSIGTKVELINIMLATDEHFCHCQKLEYLMKVISLTFQV